MTHTLSLLVLTLLHGVISSSLLYVVHTGYSILCSHFCFFIPITIDCTKSDINFLSPVPLLFYLNLVLVSIHLGNMKLYLFHILIYSALFLVLSIAIAYVKPNQSGYKNFSFEFLLSIFRVWKLYGCFVVGGPYLQNSASCSCVYISCPDDCCLLHTDQDTFDKNNDPSES